MITEVDYGGFHTSHAMVRTRSRLFGPFTACVAMVLFLIAIATIGAPSGIDASSNATADHLTGP